MLPGMTTTVLLTIVVCLLVSLAFCCGVYIALELT